MSTRVFGIGAVILVAFGSLLGCSNKIEQKECDKLRGEGFELVNAAQHCNTDPDCAQSKWPGCARAINAKSAASAGLIAEKYKKGECDEPPLKCPTEIPEAYCKQGLCVHREKGLPEGAGAPAGDVIVK